MIGKTIGHYEVIQKLGSGGMGEVWLAEDTHLERKVALKFLPSDAATEEDRNRFIREAKASSALDHPNICTIYEAGETDDGQTYIAMAYCDGETVKVKVARGPLPLEEALDIAIQIGEGLSRAHREGIVHRDIKPANAILTKDGTVKIVDFGLAKLQGATQLTRTGTSVGTAAYMSPEQVRGDEVDHRADIWALGVVLYEMVTGQQPFTGENESALMYAILNNEPEAPTAIRKDIPRQLVDVIGRAFVKDPANRYEHMQKMVEEMRNLSPVENDQKEWKKSIVVLPFENLSADPEQEYFSDGLTEEVISDLSNVRALQVISRSSAMTFKGAKKKISEIARELNVQYVLEGSVRKSGNSLRITAQLIDASNDAHLWAEKYGGTLDDVFDIQEKVSKSIVDALEVKLSSKEEEQISERPIENVQAYECYLKANADIFKFTEESIQSAIRTLQHAIEIVGDNALLYSSIALAYWNLVNIGVQQEYYLVKAEEYVNRALAEDPELAKAHAVLGWINHLGNLLESAYHLKKALSISPDDPLALQGLAVVYALVGRSPAAIPLYEKLEYIDPLDFVTKFVQAWMHIYDGQFDHAVQELGHLLKAYPEHLYANFAYAFALAYNDCPDDALLIIDSLAQKDPDNAIVKLGCMLKHALQGDKESAFELVTPGFQKTCQRDPTFSHHLACIFSLLDAKDEALIWLNSAVNSGLINYPFLADQDPFLENIRGEERFKKLMERVKHEWEDFEV